MHFILVPLCLRSHDGGPRPAEDGVSVGAGWTRWLWDESEVHGGGHRPSCWLSLCPECRLLQILIRPVFGQRGEQRQVGAGQRRGSERPVWNQEGWHSGVWVRERATDIGSDETL